VKREVFRPTGARLAAAAMAVAPGGCSIGSRRRPTGRYSSDDHRHHAGRHPGRECLRARRGGAGRAHRTTARSITTLSRALRLQSVEATFDGDLGQFTSHGIVLGDTVLSIAIISRATPRRRAFRCAADYAADVVALAARVRR